jgi:hypothetical protein
LQTDGDRAYVVADGGSNSTVKGKRFFFALGLGVLGALHVFNPATSERVKAAVLHPDGVTVTEPMDNLLVSCFFIGLCGLFDMLVARQFGPARYFALHVAVNCVTITYSFQDFFQTLVHPEHFKTCSCFHGNSPCCNKVTVCITFGIHLWHSLAYALKPIDWIHHIPAHIICLIGIFSPMGPAFNAVCLVLMGVPGGLDYLLLVFVKLKMLHPLVEKDWNQTLNVWTRAPFATFFGIIMMLGPALYPSHYSNLVHRWGTFLFGLHSYWNGNFFMARTVDARTRYIIKQKQEKEAMPTAANGNGDGKKGQ